MSKTVIPIRNPFLLDVATGLSLAAMSLLGISGLPNVLLQLTAVGLCLTFGLLYWFLFRTGRYEQRPAVYFGTQATVLAALSLLGSSVGDAFTFLFYILTVHTAVVLTSRAVRVWTAVYFVIASTIVLTSRGLPGFYAVLFYLVAFTSCAILGHTVQQTELARERNQQLLEELQTAQRNLQELAVVEERNRLARELHDSVKQQLFAISMQLGAARAFLTESHNAYMPVFEAERLANQAGAELTTLIRELRPPRLESKKLAAAVQDYAGEWSHQHGILTELKVEDIPSLPFSVEQALFRVTQETLANVGRHSNANKVMVTLVNENEEVTLTIEDNGIGFDTQHTIKGVGLESMHERLVEVGGQLDVSSRKMSGTRITAKVRRS